MHIPISSSAIILDTLVKSTLLLAIAWVTASDSEETLCRHAAHGANVCACGSAAASDLRDGVARVAHKRTAAISQEPSCNEPNSQRSLRSSHARR